jgi:acetylornithine deacetylase/succinyl-diaminopimelate desuccinylase-like protein
MTLDDVRDRVRGLMPRARQDLARAVSFKSVFDPRAEPPPDCEAMVDFTTEVFADAGLEEVRAYETADGSKTVCGRTSGPDDAPTVLLYFHHDVQPPLDERAWRSPPWELTERDGRWFGRGAADCKGNMIVHLTALRALAGELPVRVKIVGEGSEELGDGGLEDFVPRHPDLFSADVILICDAGNSAVGSPSLTTTLRGVVEVTVTVRTLSTPMHSGMFGGPAPDALAALIQMLATLRDAAGNTTIRGLDNTQRWTGAEYAADDFRRDANVLDGVDLLGDGSIADMVWARPSVTVLGIDCPRIAGSSAAVQPEASALVSLRVPPGTDAGAAHDALVAHLDAVAPWNVQIDCQRGFQGQPFTGAVSGPGFDAMTSALREVYGRDPLLLGSGGSIPLCNVFQETFPDAEIMLLGVEEPLCLIHAPNESVDPREIENMAVVEAEFLRRLGELVTR